MSLDSEKLINIRQEISQKVKELNDLNNQQSELWGKIINEFNNNKARYRKMEGLSGLIQAESMDVSGEKLLVRFDRNSNPSARALSQIEDDTGLSFKGMLESKYMFGLPK